MNPYQTHLEILQFVLDQIDCHSAFEYGPGIYSTPLLAQRFRSVTTIEMQDEKWYEDMMKSPLGLHVKVLYLPGPNRAIEYFQRLNSQFSLVFVDGHGGSRWECINAAFNHTDTIIAHDTEAPGYNWDRVKKPDDYVWLDIKKYTPWTSVITRDDKLIKALCRKFSVSNR